MAEEFERVRLVFADRGSFHDLTIDVPADATAQYGRLIDALREDPRIAASIYIDFKRLVAARVVTDEPTD
jgi:hypothetical protein